MHQLEDVVTLERGVDGIGPSTYQSIVVGLGDGLLAPVFIVDRELVDLEGRGLPFFEDAGAGERLEEELPV